MKKSAHERIKELTDKATALIRDAEKIADESGLVFSFNLEYGMGGTYYPKKMTKDEAIELVKNNGVTDVNRTQVTQALESWESSSEIGWVSSSAHC